MKKKFLAMLLALAMVLTMLPMNLLTVNAEIPDGAPFTALTTDAGDAIAYEVMDPVDYSYYEKIPYYHVTIPADATEVYVTHPTDQDPFIDTEYGNVARGYYAMTDNWSDGSGYYSFEYEAVEGGYEITIPVEDSNYGLSFVADEEGYVSHAAAVERNNFYPIAFFTFEYAAEEHTCSFGDWEQTTAPTCTTEGEKTRSCNCGKTETESVDATGHSFSNGICSVCGVADPEPERKFKQITAGETVIAESAIEYKGIFELGDNPDNDDDNYSYIHKVPYYIVEVPLGIKTVDITYKADVDIMNSKGDAYGYRTVISRGADSEVDGMSSATVKSTTFKSAYKVNEDGTQTVTTSVSNHTVDADGNRWAITLEETDSPFKAITLFSFDYPEHTCSYEAEVTAPTCEKDGYTTYTCTQCFESYIDNVVKTNGHSYQGVVTEPTCTEKGYTIYTCGTCGDAYKTDEVKLKGHTPKGEGVVTAPTCTEKGYTIYTCNDCGESYTADEVKEAGHDYKETVVDPTCTEKGYTLYKCSVCEDEYKDNETELADHSYGEDECTVCGAPVAVEDVYQLGNAEHLKWFEEFVESGNTTANAKLTADITVTDWNGIGTSSKKFAGSFDGNEKTVTFTNATNGLFAYVEGTSAKRAEIKNVTVGGAISGGNYVAGIAGKTLFANIINCINNADITGGSNVAGIAGGGNIDIYQKTDITITNCSNNGKITATGNFIGGIVGGYATGGSVIEKCCNTGYVKGNSNVGGIVGWIKGYPGDSSVTNCYNTGKVEGSSKTGGIAGEQGNASVPVTNCYNAGECTNAITGNLYINPSDHNKSAKANNTYYLTTASAQAAPVDQLHAYFSATAKSAVEMSSAEFATLLGEEFKQSCPAPVFTTQTAKDHTMVNGVCSVCNYGNTEKAEFTVTMPTDERIIVTGKTKATEGEEYTFKVEFATGYMAGENFAVTVTNHDIVNNGDGTYSVENVIDDFAISVSGVVEAKFTVTLPGDGNGYRVRAAEGNSTTVLKGNDFSFTVSIVDRFEKGSKFAVKANGTKLTAADDVYTIKNVSADQIITVEGVVEEYCEPVKVTFTITKDTDELYKVPKGGSIMLFEEMEVPYFDLALYDLGKYYYNPYCYIDENGIPRDLYIGGTRESANGVVTVMHAFIYATEVYYLGYDEEHAGKGYSNTVDKDNDRITDFYEAISWNYQSAGSTFVSFWDHGTNLNYYVNYVYPLGILPEVSETGVGVGSTADQIKLKDGDIISMHHIVADKGSASGSNFPFFVVNDDNDTFDISAQDGTNTIDIYDTVDKATVTQGEEIELSLYVGLANYEKYVTDYVKQTGKQLYMIEADKLVAELEYIDEEHLEEGQTNVWTKTPYVTDEKGEVVIDTSDFVPGTYYIVAEGGMTAGGQTDPSNSFVSAGGETGLAVLELTVEAAEACKVTLPSADEYTVNGETSVAYGSDYTFTVTISEGYEKGENFAVKVNDSVVEANEDGVYTVENVKTALEITVEGVVEKAASPEVKPGDISGDGEFNAIDITIAIGMRRAGANLTEVQMEAVDFNNNGSFDAIDITAMIGYLRSLK